MQRRPDPQTLRFNRLVTREMSRDPAWTSDDPEVVRAAFRSGVFGASAPRDDIATTRTIDGPAGPIPLRIFVPDEVVGVFLHIHGGGFFSGSHDAQDDLLWQRASQGNLAVVSVGYRLAPEHPYPAPNDDCEAAALWLTQHAQAEFGTDQLTIGGESAGAHLTAATLLRLRDRHQLTPFRGALLTYGVFDLRHTPSALAWGDRLLVISSQTLRRNKDWYLRGVDLDRTHPDISPLFADLHDLPPALFSVGTQDPLLDDSTFMAARWRAAGNDTQLDIYPGAAHSFDTMPIPVGHQVLAATTHFLAACCA